MLTEYYSEKSTYEKVSRERLDAVRALLPGRRPLSVLDVGCGAGTLGAALKEDPDITVHGIDISPAAVAAARGRLDGAWIGDLGSDSPWPPEMQETSFDAYLLSEVLEHLFFPEILLRAVRAHMAAGSVAIVTVPNVLFWKNRLRLLAGHFEYEDTGLMDRGHIHFFSWRSFRDLVRAEGFAVDAVRHVVPTRLLKPFGTLAPGLCARQFAVRLRAL